MSGTVPERWKPHFAKQEIDDYLTMAACWLHTAYERFAEDEWENNADLGEFDWVRILGVMQAMLPTDPGRAKVEDAYRRFSEAAEATIQEERHD